VRSYLLRRALLGLVAGALGACTAEEPPPPPPQAVAVRPPPPSPPAPTHPAPRPARKPAPPPAENPALATGAQPAEGASPPEGQSSPWEEPRPLGSGTETAALSPQIDLIGLDQPAATRLFGSAAEHSEEPPATIWRYKSPTCELDLFFYLDLRSGKMRTLRYAVKGGGSGPAQREECLRSLIASRGG
jgi:outer membrane biosynthesis protein TonB